MDFLDGHHYDDKETKENTACSTEKSSGHSWEGTVDLI